MSKYSFVNKKQNLSINNIAENLRLQKLACNGFVVYLNFTESKSYKLAVVILELINFIFGSLSGYCLFANLILQEFLVKKNLASSFTYLFFFTSIQPLLLFFDFLLRTKIGFFLKKLYDVNQNEFVLFFELIQNLSFESTQKYKISMTYKFYMCYFGIVSVLLHVLKQTSVGQYSIEKI